MNPTQTMEYVLKSIERIDSQMSLIEICRHNIRAMSKRRLVWNEEWDTFIIQYYNTDEVPKLWNTIRLSMNEILLICRKIRHVLGDRWEPGNTGFPWDMMSEQMRVVDNGMDGTVYVEPHLAIVRGYDGVPTTIDIRKIERYRIQNDR